MRRQTALGAIALGVAAFVGALGARALGGLRGGGPAGFGMMMNGGSMEQMMAPSNRGAMRTGMALFRSHAEVRRSVTHLPNGIRAVSESDDPRIATLLQTHVAQMYARLDSKNAFPYPMSRSVPQLFAKSARYRRKLTLLPKGIEVLETSGDPEMVALIHAHAREIDGFVKDGMPSMMRSMMS